MSTFVRGAHLTHFDAVAHALDLDPTQLRRDVGLDRNAGQDLDQWLPADRVAALLEAAAERSGAENFGLRMAPGRRLSNPGPLGMLLRDQATLHEALAALTQNYAAIDNSVSIYLQCEGDEARLCVHAVLGRPQPVRQGVELVMGVLVGVLRDHLGALWEPHSASFAHAAPRDRTLHLMLFGPQVRFNEPRHALVFDRAELATRKADTDPAMLRYAEQLMGGVMAKHPQGAVVESVRHLVVLLLPQGRCNIEHLASHLGMVGRTLQRQLANRGTQFSTVVDDVRHELAERHLLNSQRPLGQLAELLGFGSVSSFSRWYSARTGMAPSARRANAERVRADSA